MVVAAPSPFARGRTMALNRAGLAMDMVDLSAKRGADITENGV